MGLLNELRKYVNDAMPGGLLNSEVPKPSNVLSGLLSNAQPMPSIGGITSGIDNIKRTTARRLADLINNPRDYLAQTIAQTPQTIAEQGAGLAPMGLGAMTAWHGSPHKFDKFSLDKIGTGEGAQAYGHGLYLAESPKVAQEYANTLGTTIKVDGKPVLQANKATRTGNDAIDLDLMANLGNLKAAERDSLNAIKQLRAYDPNHPGIKEAQRELANVRALRGRVETSYDGNLYKTDIPDEAVSRFLDWDKPLSQQAPEVQAAMEKAAKLKGVQLRGPWGGA